MSFANYKPFHIVKASATSKSSNDRTYQQLATTTTSLSLKVIVNT